ncbi:MAG: FAD-dependent oxidoreductase [Candidatus Bruticola sp.]
MKRYVIVGGGAAGLTLAYYLCKAGLPTVVIERESNVGGLSRTFHYGDWSFDIGPHRFYSQNPKVNRFLKEVQGDGFAEIPRFSQVYFMGKYHEWPLRLETIAKLPPNVALQAGLDMFFRTGRSNRSSSNTFKDYVLCRYGKTLYETFFKDYTEKFVGISTENTHRNWAKIGLERATIDDNVNTASLFEIFKLMLLPKKAELNFLYPNSGGICSFWENCQRRIIDMGGEIITQSEVSALIYSVTDNGLNEISEVVTTKGKIECQELAWSASINELANKLNLTPTQLDYRSQIICSVMLDKPPKHRSQWCYFGDKNLLFSRISNPSCFSPSCAPQGRGGLCLEITCQYQDDMWHDPEKLIPRLIEELHQVGVINDSIKVLDARVEKIRDAYPIYSLNYIDRLNLLDKECSAFKNLELLGRTGRFWYNNLDHSIENSLSTAAKYLKKLHNLSAKAESVMEEVS